MFRLVAAEKGKPITNDLSNPPPIKLPRDYVMQTWFDHRKHGTYPRAGGYDDQDPDLMSDWHVLNLYHLRAEYGIVSIKLPTNATDWRTLRKG